MSVGDSKPPAQSLFPGASGWIAAVILTMPMREVSLVSFGGANLRIGDVVLALAIALWLTALGWRGRVPWGSRGLDRAISVLIVVYAASLLWSDQSTHGWVRIFKLTRNGLMYAMLVAYLRLDFKTGYRRIALCLLATGLMQSLAFVYTIGEHGGSEALRIMADATTLLSNDARLAAVKSPSGAGLFLAGGASWLPLCMFFGIGLAHETKTWAGGKFIWLLIAAMGFLTVLTMSRSAWAGLATGSFVYLGGLKPRKAFRLLLVALIASGVVVAIGWSSTIANVFGSRLNIDLLLLDPSLDDRSNYFALAFDSFRRNPLFGGGAAGIDPGEFIVVHNVYLQVLGELGLLGVVVFGTVLWRWIRALERAWRLSIRARDEHGRTTTAAMMGISAFFLTYFLAGHDLESGEPWIVMATVSALCSVASGAASVHRALAHRDKLAGETLAPEVTCRL